MAGRVIRAEHCARDGRLMSDFLRVVLAKRRWRRSRSRNAFTHSTGMRHTDPLQFLRKNAPDTLIPCGREASSARSARLAGKLSGSSRTCWWIPDGSALQRRSLPSEAFGGVQTGLRTLPGRDRRRAGVMRRSSAGWPLWGGLTGAVPDRLRRRLTCSVRTARAPDRPPPSPRHGTRRGLC